MLVTIYLFDIGINAQAKPEKLILSRDTIGIHIHLLNVKI